MAKRSNSQYIRGGGIENQLYTGCKKMEMNRSQVQNLILYAWDVLGITIGYFLMTYVRFYSRGYKYWIGDDRVYYRWFFAVLMLTLVYLLFYPNKDFFKRKFKDELICNLKTNAIAAVLMATIAYLIQDANNYSRFIYFGTVGFSLYWMQLVHTIYRKYILDNRGRTRTVRNILVICKKEKAEEIVFNIIKEKSYDLWVKGIIIVDDDMIGEKIFDIPVVADYRSMLLYATRTMVDEVFIQSSCFAEDEIKEIISKFDDMGAKVNLSIDLFNMKVDIPKRMGKIGIYDTVTFSSNEIPLRMLIGKRLLDIVGGFVGVVLTGIITIVLGPLIKLESPGPIFFSQKRVGKNGRVFKIYKFRSMYMDAEERKKELMEQNEMQGLMFKIKDDPRITKVGKFIRKTSLDEFPQFWNVLKGEMSLVGTRPPTEDEFKQYKVHHKKRLGMTPGLTGVWQVSGRSDITDFEEVVNMDVEYIENWSLKRDIKILLKTIQVVLSNESGAR